MKIILLFLVTLVSFTIHAQSPLQTVEQTVRHICQSHKSDATAPCFGEIGERAITSACIQQALTLDDNLTLLGNIGWLDYDPVYDCQDFGDLVLEGVAITQTDADHADTIVRFRIFQDDKEKTSQTLKMVTENGRWVINGIVNNHGSVLQAVSSESEKMLAAIALLRKEQPEAFIAGFFEHIADYNWPWTRVVSDSYRQAVNIFYKTTSKTTNNSDEGMPIKRRFIHDSSICLGEEPLFSRVDGVGVLEKITDSVRTYVRFVLTNGSNEEQGLTLQRHESKWEVTDFIRPNSGSLFEQIEVEAAARLKQWAELNNN